MPTYAEGLEERKKREQNHACMQGHGHADQNEN